MSNLKIVRDFCAVWAARDLDRIMGFIAPDCFYHNIPMAPVVGDGPIREFMKGFLGMASEIEFRVHFDAENPAGVVMNERTDRFQINGTWVELPVMGVFELQDGKIAKWRDYFDANQFNTQLAKATKQ